MRSSRKRVFDAPDVVDAADVAAAVAVAVAAEVRAEVKAVVANRGSRRWAKVPADSALAADDATTTIVEAVITVVEAEVDEADAEVAVAVVAVVADARKWRSEALSHSSSRAGAADKSSRRTLVAVATTRK